MGEYALGAEGLFDDQHRRVLALNAARDVLAAKTIMTSGATASDELIKVAEYIIGDEAEDFIGAQSLKIGGVVTTNVEQFLDDRKPRCNMPDSFASDPSRCTLPDDHEGEHSDGKTTWSSPDDEFDDV
ncbi:hypothetical protein SEA_CHERRYONLIM_65 [Gordonia phage CherryonLim]|uniref:Uncharacterized protein n=1 Tax=Gordonia phage CherryonLim TaxID=2652411 RepID=A0A5P8DA08_9CAUD|nr:hypothetical protein PP994_gp65 [Gordonia phage CherryonLim]QFP95818.1 hypothetical protein SEA_CHERRYONLIM_65 [Gordonia phage CherryonLim]